VTVFAEAGHRRSGQGQAVHHAAGRARRPLIASGKVEIGLQQITERLATPGIDLVGPLPKELQTKISYVIARPLTRQRAESRRPRFVKFPLLRCGAAVMKKMAWTL